MSIPLHSYLKRNRFGVYYFRRIIPLDLRAHFGFGQIARSTRTCNSQAAQSLALRLSASVDQLFLRVRKMAKQPKPDLISQELIVELGFDIEGLLTSVKTDAKPGEEDAAGRLVPVLIQAAREGVLKGALESLNYDISLIPYKSLPEHEMARKRGQRRSAP